MTQKEREREVRRRLYKYASYKRDVLQFTEDILYGTPSHDESGVRGTDISDPSGRAGTLLADMPAHLREKQKWIDAIDDAYDELVACDHGNKRGYAYVCNRIYGLDGRKKRSVIAVSIECEISERAMYRRLNIITNIVCYHAAKNGLFQIDTDEYP